MGPLLPATTVGVHADVVHNSNVSEHETARLGRVSESLARGCDAEPDEGEPPGLRCSEAAAKALSRKQPKVTEVTFVAGNSLRGLRGAAESARNNRAGGERDLDAVTGDRGDGRGDGGAPRVAEKRETGLHPSEVGRVTWCSGGA